MDKFCPDQIDLEIMKLLQKEARLSYNEIGRRLHKSKTPIIDRMKRLEKTGYIEGYVALLDYARLRNCLMTYVHVQLTDHSGEALEAFQDEVSAFPEVMECSHTTGAFDFILKVVTKSVQEYTGFLKARIHQLPHIGQVSSSMVLAQCKRTTAVPI